MFLLLAPAIVGMCYLIPELVRVIYTNFSDSKAALTSNFAIFFLGSVLYTVFIHKGICIKRALSIHSPSTWILGHNSHIKDV